MNPPPVAAAPRLLVVDDEPDLRTLYELALLREGYDIETAACVEEAWALLQAARFDAVITDMRLPDGNGLELLRRLEQAGRPRRRWSSPPTARPRTRCWRSRPVPSTI